MRRKRKPIGDFPFWATRKQQIVSYEEADEIADSLIANARTQQPQA